MDLKAAGNRLYQVGATHDELGGSHWTLVRSLDGGHVPKVNPELAKRTFQAIHDLIQAGRIAACHDLSEGGLAVAAAEMAFAGGLGLQIQLSNVPSELSSETEHGCLVALFSESNTRFLCEVAETNQQAFEEGLAAAEIPFGLIGEVVDEDSLTITIAGNEGSAEAGDQQLVLSEKLEKLKASWQEPLKW
jgi:phosphoribosylformylglycinamidine synthase